MWTRWPSATTVRKAESNHEEMLELYKCEIQSHCMACDMTSLETGREEKKKRGGREKGKSDGTGNVLTEALS